MLQKGVFMKYLLLLCFIPCALFSQEQFQESVIEYYVREFILNTKEEIYYNHGNMCSRCYLQGKLEAYEHVLETILSNSGS
jgi:hypothetical protein